MLQAHRRQPRRDRDRDGPVLGHAGSESAPRCQWPRPGGGIASPRRRGGSVTVTAGRVQPGPGATAASFPVPRPPPRPPESSPADSETDSEAVDSDGESEILLSLTRRVNGPGQRRAGGPARGGADLSAATRDAPRHAPLGETGAPRGPAPQRPRLLRARCRGGPCHRRGGPAVIHERCCTPSLAPWNQAMAGKHEFELLL